MYNQPPILNTCNPTLQRQVPCADLKVKDMACVIELQIISRMFYQCLTCEKARGNYVVLFDCPLDIRRI